MRKAEVFPSKFLKCADLKGKPVTVTIAAAPLEELKSPDGKESSKVVLYFRGAKKGLPLNRVNWDAVSDIVGDDDSDSWIGHRVELYPTKTEMAGKLVDCIRVRAPKQRELPKALPPVEEPPPVAAIPPMADEMDDAIPF